VSARLAYIFILLSDIDIGYLPLSYIILDTDLLIYIFFDGSMPRSYAFEPYAIVSLSLSALQSFPLQAIFFYALALLMACGWLHISYLL